MDIVQEPREIKKLIKEVRKRLGNNTDIKNDSLAVWSFNRLPKYLWDNWKTELKKSGIKWQEFLKILRIHTNDLIQWALYDSLKWEELVKRIKRTLQQYKKR